MERINLILAKIRAQGHSPVHDLEIISNHCYEIQGIVNVQRGREGGK